MTPTNNDSNTTPTGRIRRRMGYFSSDYPNIQQVPVPLDAGSLLIQAEASRSFDEWARNSLQKAREAAGVAGDFVVFEESVLFEVADGNDDGVPWSIS